MGKSLSLSKVTAQGSKKPQSLPNSAAFPSQCNLGSRLRPETNVYMLTFALTDLVFFVRKVVAPFLTETCFREILIYITGQLQSLQVVCLMNEKCNHFSEF